MIISICCMAALCVVGVGADTYYTCQKCGKATEGKFVLQFIFEKERENAEVLSNIIFKTI